MRRSASKALECGTSLNALLLIGSILLAGRDEPDLTVGREANNCSLRSPFHLTREQHLWRFREGAKDVTLASYWL
jgi:hypothetical protein